MKIREVEELLEIPRSTIRYFESEGLITPQRNPDNDYREYTDEDVQKLKRILIFRKLGISLADIEDLFEGNRDMESLLDEQIGRLQSQKEKTEAAIAVCQQMRSEGVSVSSLDEDFWWDEIHEKEKHGNTFFDHLSADVQIALCRAVSQVEYSASHGPRTPELIWNPAQKTTRRIQSFWRSHAVVHAVLVFVVLLLSLLFVIFISSM